MRKLFFCLPVVIGMLLLVAACGDKDKKPGGPDLAKAVSGIYSMRYSLDEGEWIETTATIVKFLPISASLTMPQSNEDGRNLVYIGLPLVSAPDKVTFSHSYKTTVHIGPEVLENATIDITGAFDYAGGETMPYHLHFSGTITPAPFEDEDGEIVHPEPIWIVARDIRMPVVA